MPPLALIGGIPLGVYQRARTLPTIPGWEVRVVASQDHNRADLRRIWNRILNEADQSDADGVHLILVHDMEGEHPFFAREIAAHYRVIWMAGSEARQYGKSNFDEALQSALRFEEGWRSEIRPTVDSPLLLPETGFSAHTSVAAVWRRAISVREGRDSLAAVRQVVQRFRGRHRVQRVWRDERSLNFHRGVPHGHHIPVRQRRKLTFDLPKGFHFDVEADGARPFWINDSSGNRRDFDEYANIDPHGFLRGGS